MRPGVIFFPVSLPVDAVQTLFRESALPSTVAQLVTRGNVRGAVGALLSAHDVPMSEFFAAVSALRASRLRRV